MLTSEKISVKENHREWKNSFFIALMIISRNSGNVWYYSGLMKGTKEAETERNSSPLLKCESENCHIMDDCIESLKSK